MPLPSSLHHSTCHLQVQRVDAEILAAVRQQSTSGSRARADLAGARSTIEELFAKIHEIQRKAEQSELMVQEICRDIKKLDYAKKHLTATITALRRLSMLVNAVDQLQLAVERHEYAEAAHLLEAVQQLSSHFQSYVHIPKVAELKARLQALERSLQINTLREFELLGEEPPSPLLLERLRSCCLVVEALGYQVCAPGWVGGLRCRSGAWQDGVGGGARWGWVAGSAHRLPVCATAAAVAAVAKGWGRQASGLLHLLLP